VSQLSVSGHISGITAPNFTDFLCMLTLAVALSFSDSVVICYVYVLPVLWMTSCSALIGEAKATQVRRKLKTASKRAGPDRGQNLMSTIAELSIGVFSVS